MSSRSMPSRVHWKVEECAVYFDRLHLRGWCHHSDRRIVRVEALINDTIPVRLASFGLESPDLSEEFGPAAANARFDEWLYAPPQLLGRNFSLRMWLDDEEYVLGEDALTNAAHGDPYFQIWENFIAGLSEFDSGAVLEIGARARSAVTRKHRIPEQLDYVGLDILEGPNVDIVGDAHELSRVLRGRKFVAAFSTSVFEHLAMPWKVVLELNKVLELGGLVYTSTHQTWPPHELPWDFWRFSENAWPALFNSSTGFEVVEAVVGEPARVHPCRTSPVTREMPGCIAWLGSASIVRKTGETLLDWPVPLRVVTKSNYPSGELAAPPTTDAT